MHRVAVIILLSSAVQHHARDHDSNVDKLTDNLIDKLQAVFDRAQMASQLHMANLDNTMLGKPGPGTAMKAKPGHAAMPSCTSLRPFVLPASSLAPPLHHKLPRTPGDSSRWAGNRQKCTVQATLQSERKDPNLTPGAIKSLKPIDKIDDLEFNDVQVRVYNIDRWNMSPIAAKALKKNCEAIWHVGVTVFGKEYWYGAIVESQNLTEVDYVFGFGPTHVYNIGKTDLDPEEFDKWVFEDRAREYQVEKYDCFNHNCHHFARDLVLKLTGKTPEQGGFPQWCLDHAEQALSELGDEKADQIRWVSNRIAKVMMVSWGKYNRERFKEHTDVQAAQFQAKRNPILTPWSSFSGWGQLERPRVLEDAK